MLPKEFVCKTWNVLIAEMSLLKSHEPYGEEVHEPTLVYHGDGCVDEKVLAANLDTPSGIGNYLFIHVKYGILIVCNQPLEDNETIGLQEMVRLTNHWSLIVSGIVLVSSANFTIELSGVGEGLSLWRHKKLAQAAEPWMMLAEIAMNSDSTPPNREQWVWVRKKSTSQLSKKSGNSIFE